MNRAPILQIDLSVAAPVEIGVVDGQNRRCIPITGGTVSGGYTGVVLSGGADWQVIAPDGTLDINAHYVLQLREGPVEVESRGLRSGPPDVLARLAAGEIVDPKRYYFRTAMRFKTAVPALSHLNHILAISVGERLPDTVRLTVYEVA
jgi:acyl-coenzyme A thioesterase PaaI-like protein